MEFMCLRYSRGRPLSRNIIDDNSNDVIMSASINEVGSATSMRCSERFIAFISFSGMGRTTFMDLMIP